MNYTVKNELYGFFFTDLMDSYGFCSQSLQVWSTQGWHVCCQSTNEPEASEGESARTGNSRLNHKRQIVVSNVTKYLLKRTLII